MGRVFGGEENGRRWPVVWMVTRHCGDHFVLFTNIELLFYTPETYIILYDNLTTILKTNNKLVLFNALW